MYKREDTMILLEYNVTNRNGDAVPHRHEFPCMDTAETYYITAKVAIEKKGGQISSPCYTEHS